MTAPAHSALAAQLAAVQSQLPSAQAPMVPPMPFVPPEAHGAVATAASVAAAAPALPPLPAGWHWGPDSKPRADAPAGCQYNAAGQLEQIPAAPPPAPPGFQYNAAGGLEQIPVVVAAQAATEAPVPVPAQTGTPTGGRKGGGRPKGAKNKPKEGATSTEEQDNFDRLFNACCDANEGSALRTLTIAQLEAVAAVLDAA